MRNRLSAMTRKSLADLSLRKGRATLVILSILIGVFGLTAVNAATENIGSAFAYTRDQSAVPDLTFSIGAHRPDLIQRIAALPNVATVQTRWEYLTHWLVSGGTGQVEMQIWGYDDFNAIKLQPFQLTSGHLPGPGEIVLETFDKALQPVSIGDTITVAGVGKQMVTFRVVGFGRTQGIAPLKEQRPGLSLGYTSASYLRQTVSGAMVTGQITRKNKTLTRLTTGIEARVKNMNQVGQTYNAVNGLLTADRVVVTAGDDQNFTYIEAEVAGVLGIIRALSVLTLLLSCVLILNTITTLVSEQTGIIGTMKALGGTRWRITGGYLLSIGIYSLIGTTLGIGLGLPASVYLSSLLATLVELDLGPFQLPYGVIGLSLVVGLLVPLLAALLPLWNGTKITVHEAISAYGVVRGERAGRFTAFGRRLTWVSQTAWLGLRGLFRKPLRVGLTLLALTFSAATFTAIQISNTSVSSTVAAVNAAFSTDVTMDLQFLSLQNYSQFRSQILALPNVAAVERLHTQGDVSVYGQHLPIWGVEPNTTLYHYHLVAGRWFQGNEQNVIVLNDRVAQQLHLHVGSILPVTSQATARWQVIGIVHDLNITDVSLDQSLGSAYVPFDELVAISGNQGIHTLLIGARDRSPAAVDQLAGRLNSLMNTTGNYGTLITRAQAEQAQQGPGQITGIIFDAVAFIVGLVALLGLFNTLSTSVIERRLEIGILRSMGATGRRVASVFWIEGLALVLLAWFGGVVLGIPGAALLLGLLGQLFLKFEFFLTPLSLVLTLAFALIVAFIANVGPALSASRLRIREILRYE